MDLYKTTSGTLSFRLEIARLRPPLMANKQQMLVLPYHGPQYPFILLRSDMTNVPSGVHAGQAGRRERKGQASRPLFIYITTAPTTDRVCSCGSVPHLCILQAGVGWRGKKWICISLRSCARANKKNISGLRFVSFCSRRFAGGFPIIVLLLFLLFLGLSSEVAVRTLVHMKAFV
jgi:hypothetical protein